MRREGGAWTTSSSVGQRVSYLSLREQIKHALRRPRIVSRLWVHVKVRFGPVCLVDCQRSSLYDVCRTLTAHTFFVPLDATQWRDSHHGISRDFFDSQLWRDLRSTALPGGYGRWFDYGHYHGMCAV
jgi:hypothetical protein